MLKRHFDPRRPHRYVRYGRMSTEMQNPRSPEQQFDTINLTLRRLGYTWAHAVDYRDDAISGRFVAKRPGFQKMLADLRSGSVDADLILVDTFERFGRADEIAAIRQQLSSRYKILVLTADSQFTDPTSGAGRALAMIENIRATEDGRVKAHNVLRGKRDLASRRRWPGGPIPLGFRLRSVLVERGTSQEVDGHVLEPDPISKKVPARIFALALENGWGARRIARALNDDPAIPAQVKPISEEIVRLCHRNTLYMGVLTYGKHCTGIVDDRYVRERVEPGEELVVEEFCEAIVSREDFLAVEEQRRSRPQSHARKPSRPQRPGDDEPIEVYPEARKYLLTGLVRCGDCGGPMDLTSSMNRKRREARSYRYYKCRNHAMRRCDHRSGVREDILLRAVVAKLRSRLFPPPGQDEPTPSWLTGLTAEVRREVESRSRGEGDPRPALEEEIRKLEGQVKGWSISLGNIDLPSSSRSTLEGLLEGALERRREVEAQLAGLEATRTRLDEALDEGAVLDRLRRLHEVLASGNVGEGNRELGRVVERVACHSDGRVELRTHRHGLLEGLDAWLAPAGPGHPRSTVDPAENAGSAYWTDPIEFAKPPRAVYRSWPRDHATEVLAKREETGWSVKRLAEHFGKCWDTIDRALELAKSSRTAPADRSGRGT